MDIVSPFFVIVLLNNEVTSKFAHPFIHENVFNFIMFWGVLVSVNKNMIDKRSVDLTIEHRIPTTVATNLTIELLNIRTKTT